MNASVFLTWLNLFILDGRESHKDLQVILYAHDSHIHIIKGLKPFKMNMSIV